MPIELQTNIALETTPVAPEHLVNVKWVEDFVAGKIKAPVRLVATNDQAGTYTTSNMEFHFTAAGEIEFDDHELDHDDRVLLAGQTDGRHNGIYTVTTKGTGATHTVLTRAHDFDHDDKISSGVTVAVHEGDEHADTTWKLITPDPIVLDTTHLEFVPVTPTTGAAKFAVTIHGDGVDRDFQISHNLGSTDVSVSIWNLSTHSVVLTDVRTLNNNQVEIGFAEPPSAAHGPYRVVVIG